MLNEQNLAKAMMALAKTYISVFEFNIKNDFLEPIKSNEFIDAWSEPFEGAQEKLNNVMKNITADDYIDAMMDFSNLSTLAERLKDKNEVYIDFVGKINGWCRVRFIVEDYDADGELLSVIHTVESINAEKAKENNLSHLAMIDSMTGILNRGSGEKLMRDALNNQVEGLFIIIDADGFKSINDKFGHAIGDKVIVAIAGVMKSIAAEDDIVMRLGGDEFAIYFKGITDVSSAEMVILNLFEEFKRIRISPMEEALSVSIGARMYRPGDDFESIYREADKGVYLSKRTYGCSFEII